MRNPFRITRHRFRICGTPGGGGWSERELEQWRDRRALTTLFPWEWKEGND